MVFALKIDVDTFRGMREGLPRMLDTLGRRSIRATIFVSIGPDHTGRAIRRIFTKPGFFAKMIRTRAVSLYGPRTILYGTFLPGPRIARENADVFRRIESEGHEAGVHGWDHVRWQDGLPKFSEETIAREMAKAFAVYEELAGHRPRSTAAPGWIANARSLEVQDSLDLLYCSDVRGAFPFIPRIGERIFRTPQVPTTLPTLDEMIGGGRESWGSRAREILPSRRGQMEGPSRGGQMEDPARQGAGVDEAWINDFLVKESLRQAQERPDSPIVHTVHTEVEGFSRAELFADLLDRLIAEGARFARLDQTAAIIPSPGPPDVAVTRNMGATTPSSRREGLPVCEVRDGVLPGRSGKLSVQVIG